MEGIIGRRFDWREPDGVTRRYQVVETNKKETEIIVTCDYVDHPEPQIP
jgi:hypothetical protein